MAETDDLRQDLDNLKADMDAVRSDLADLTRAFRDIGAERLQGTRDSVEEELRRAREALGRRAEEARLRGREVRDAGERQVAEHPYGALLTALGAGFLLAKLLDLGRR